MSGWKRSALVGVAWVAAHEVATRACDRVGVVERMLSPGGGGAAIVGAAVATVALFALRLGVVFVLPGWLLARAIEAWRAD